MSRGRPTLIEASNVMDDVVVVAFGTQKKESLVGAVQVVRPSTLKVTSSNLSTSFAGKIAGVISTQSSGEPGADGANFWIRGISTFGANKSPLLILDGSSRFRSCATPRPRRSTVRAAPTA